MARQEKPLSDDAFKQRREIMRIQPFLREATTLAGLHKACALPKCRRAKQCLGWRREAEIGTGHYSNFPPCVFDGPTHAAFCAACLRVLERYRQELLAAGYSPEQLDTDEAEDPDWDNDDGSDDPLRRVSPASRKAR